MTLKREKIVLTALVGLAATGTLLVQQEKLVEASPYTSGLESATSTNQKQIVINLVDDAGNPVTWFQADGTNGGSSIEYAGQDGNLEGMQLIACQPALLQLEYHLLIRVKSQWYKAVNST